MVDWWRQSGRRFALNNFEMERFHAPNFCRDQGMGTRGSSRYGKNCKRVYRGARVLTAFA